MSPHDTPKFMPKIENQQQLRSIYGEPQEIAIAKVQSSLDKHCKHFIKLSPFVTISSSNTQGHADVSPRGDNPGFVKIMNDHTLLLPDRPGNKRVDTISNILQNPEIGMLFFVPGVKETLRVNGTAEIYNDEELLKLCIENGKLPLTVIKITIREAFVHCAKSLMRSGLWDSNVQINRKDFPTTSQIFGEQTSMIDPTVSQEETDKHFAESIASIG